MHRTPLRLALILFAVAPSVTFTPSAFAAPSTIPTREGSGLPLVSSPLPAPLTQSATNLAATGRDGNWIPVPDLPLPSPDISTRDGHTIVFDTVNQRFIAFGGEVNSGGSRLNDVWTHPINGTTPWVPLTVAGSAPSPRFQPSAVYDAAGQRMLVFGGDVGGVLQNDLWQLDLAAATPTWSPVVTSGSPPSPRSEPTAVFDPVRRQMILFGGRPAAGATNETWILDCAASPPTWQLASTSGSLPYERSSHAAIFDAVHDRMVIYGGLGSFYYLGDVWTLSMGTLAWTQKLGTGGPTVPAYGMGAGYDPSGNRMFVSAHGELWSLALDTFAWTQWTLPSQPGARVYAGFAIEPSGHHGILNGGLPSAGDTWLLTIAGAPSWTQFPPPPTPPAVNRRYAAAGAFDPLRERFVMIGGAGISESNLLGDIAHLTIGADSGWVSGGSNAVLRMAMNAIYDPIRDRFVVIGGYNGSYLNDVKMIDAATLLPSSVTPFGAPPDTRDYFSAIYDPIRDRIVIYGGNHAGVALNDVWALNLSPSLSWSPITPDPSSGPLPRMLHSAVYDPVGDRMIVFGGADGGSGTFNDLWSLKLGGTPEWLYLSPPGSRPSTRYGHTLQYDPNRQRVLVFGGTSPSAPPTNDLWEIPLGGGPFAWHQLSPGGVLPSPRYVHFGVYDPVFDRLLVSGGASGSGTLADVWRLQFSSDAPTATAVALLSHDVRSDEVVLNWGLSGDAATFARLERRDGSSDWRTIEAGPVSGSFVTFHDRDVRAGGRYGYRLTAIAGAEASTSSEVWIDVPAGPNFSLASFSPNPATREGRVAFSLAERTPATIEVVDVGGRRVAMRRIESPAPGAQVIAIAPEGGLSPGLYFVRLTQGSRTATVRGTIVR